MTNTTVDQLLQNMTPSSWVLTIQMGRDLSRMDLQSLGASILTWVDDARHDILDDITRVSSSIDGDLRDDVVVGVLQGNGGFDR